MMTVPMDDENSLAPEKRERAQRLLKRIVELENGLRKSAQMKVPSDPNAWAEMRDKYEAIILEDHDFSEKHEIEFHLWQLHYRRIEEFRSHINAAATASQRGKNTSKPDQIKKIRGIFKSFLSESTGFYHDLIQKIRSKYGLPLGYFGEGADNQVLSLKDEKKSSEIKKGLLSCHRCLIYLGDLARYKALYGEGDSVTGDFAAASSYYMQASSLWPGSGNPHHQLAILASYSGDELVAIYRYFRSLSVDSPFTTARDNLIIAFEKNRQSYSQLPNNSSMGPSARSLPTRVARKDRRRGDSRPTAKDATTESTTPNEQELSVPEIFKAFSTSFVRLNGILFTRTSLETFAEVFSSSIRDLNTLLASGANEEFNFGIDAHENGLVIVRLIAILIFTVHNTSRESENQSYADILQRSVLLQNAFTAAFEFAGQILKRSSQLNDAASSYLTPGILVFSEWLACHQEMATVSDAEEKQAAARSFFWNQFVAFINKLISGGLVSFNSNEDDSCFSDMIHYDDEETGNRLALWEDIELRGFSPLVPSHLILDFSRKHPRGSDGSSKEKTARAERILAAAKVLMNVVRVDNQGIYFDQSQKKVIISVEPPAYEEPVSVLDVPLSRGIQKESSIGITGDIGAMQSKFSANSKAELVLEGDDEDEEIVFKPNATDKLFISSSNNNDVAQHGQSYPNGEWVGYGGDSSMPFASMQMPISAASSSKISAPVIPSMQLLQQMNPSTSHRFTGQYFVSDELNALKIIENGPMQQGLQEQFKPLNSTAYQNSFSAANNLASSMMIDGRGKLAENFMSSLPGQFPSLAKSDVGAMSITARASPPSSVKNPVSRPVRHVGPPPGFTNVPSRQPDGVLLNSAGKESYLQVDDYSWLDGYQSSIVKDVDKEMPSHVANAYSRPNVGKTSALTDAMSFPFPGKQIPVAQVKVQNEKWQDFQLFDQHKMYTEEQFQQPMHRAPSPKQHQAQSLWSGHYYV